MSRQVSPRRSRLEATALYIDRVLAAIGVGLGWVGSRLFVRVGPVRAVLEALLVNGLAVLLVWPLDPHGGAEAPAWMQYPFVLDILLVSALRLRLPAGAPWYRDIRESLICLVLLLPFCLGWVFLETARGQPYFSAFGPLSPLTPPWQVVLGVLGEMTLIFLWLRGALHLWFILERRRRRHLRWQLTYGLLLLVALSQGPSLFAEALGELSTAAITARLDPSWLPLWIILGMIFYFLPALIFALIPVLIIASVLFVLFSSVIIGGFTRGLETLVAECAALRGGNYDARLVVQGEDEVAQLQLEFNDMTDELQHVLVALRAERDALRAEKELTQQLKTQIAELHIEVDQQRRARDVAEITGTDYFRDLKQKAEQLRTRAARPAPAE